MVDRCVCCGEIIPEGMMACPNCLVASKRQATESKQLIYREDLIAEYDRVHIGHPGGARKLMEDAPTVDAVEVVRCKDCKHHKLPAVLTQKYGEPGTLTCHNWHSPCNKRNVKADGFCPYGERKDNG